ncbi:MAG: ABC transporter ATP-binding protein [Burkholderiaceae bacterium]|jgi:branched-chain amino acid transport system ATP-binding protein|nr:ABC transporter ATP-binding protein [Betaproteobacteria bacterium]MDA8599724.1 ABC transporter ATP-binding protein [Burkholderiaceae bacterium]MCH9847069.1 ABC transporter ATP-binding protein [Betaproteobacteria bacterium]MDB4214936.1 ABC transporter ATP-binding protein [Burkholderiaceae bacterium]MDC1457746.1 ABC transporter ATP-binding protein [Burkholderiaceae bacterium]|tara:strand:- start:4399 stop:5100 length:702 start_codon:yes stop_codon:yes gene_type:complete
MLSIKQLRAHYGTSQALFDINLSIEAGQVATLLGRNGMGKTTTIHSVMGIVKPTGGTVTFEGVSLVGLPSFKIANLGIGLVPEGRQIFPNLTVRENLVATASNHLGLDQPWSSERILAMFPELATRLSSMGNLLSGGEQQMLAIGRALMTNPRLLILDEATEGLAPLVRKRIWEALDNIRQTGLSILVVDKNLKDLMRLADKHHIVQRGEVVWSGSSAALAADRDALSNYLGV